MPATQITDIDTLIDEAWESSMWAWESWAETQAQYRSECAMFGDAGPGQAIDVFNALQNAQACEAHAFHLSSVHGRLADHGPAVPVIYEEGVDEPF
jgi:hypothetical protein